MSTKLYSVYTSLMARFDSENEEGASLVEYALLVALIAVICIIAIQLIGTQANTAFESVGSSLQSANS